MPTNGKIRNYKSYNHSLPENTNITFLCDDNFLPDKEYTATCNNSGEWSIDPAMLECHLDKEQQSVCIQNFHT